MARATGETRCISFRWQPDEDVDNVKSTLIKLKQDYGAKVIGRGVVGGGRLLGNDPQKEKWLMRSSSMGSYLLSLSFSFTRDGVKSC